MPPAALTLLIAGILVVLTVVVAVAVVSRQLTATSHTIRQLADRLADAETRSEQLRAQLDEAAQAVAQVRSSDAADDTAPAGDATNPEVTTHHG